MRIGYMNAGATTVLLPAIIEDNFSKLDIEELFSGDKNELPDKSSLGSNYNQTSGLEPLESNIEEKQSKVAKKILLIDDDKLILMTLKRLLAKEGYKITTALNGMAALRHIQEAEFDLIISDIKMPNMDGVETVKKIREYLVKNNKKPIPEIFITAYAKEEIYQMALSLKAAGYIEKPFDIKALLQAVRKIIGNELV